MTILNRLAVGGSALLLFGLAVPPATGAGTEVRQAGVPALAAPLATGMSAVAGVSFDGRYLLGRLGGRWVVRDLVAGRTVRKLPSSWRYSYDGLSAAGKLVAYRRVSAFAGCQVAVPKVRNRITNRSRWLATDSRGKQLKAKWRAPRCPGDEDDSRLAYNPQFSHPALSADGRTAAFCANLEQPNRYDLYVKRLTNGKLTRLAGACSAWSDGGDTGFQTPQLSADGSVILLPGVDDESATWGPYRLVVGGHLRENLIGRDPRLTANGAKVYASRPTGSCEPSSCLHEPIGYDVATAGVSVLPTGTPVDTAMSADGNLALVEAWPQLAVFNRATAVTTDLTATLQASGLQQGYLPGLPTISGDGRWVVFGAGGLVYLLDLAS